MNKITRTASRAAEFISGRTGARMLLILCCFVCAYFFAPYLKTVSIVADGETQTYITTRSSDPEELFTQVGLSLDGGDQYYEVIDEETDQSEYHIVRAFTITIDDAGVSGEYEVAGGTVAEALLQAGIDYPDSDDEISYSLEDEVFAYMEIDINRVEYVDEESVVVIPYQTLKHETDEMTKGQTKVSVVGVNGQKKVVTRKQYINGSFVAETVVSEKITAEAVNEVIDVGTAVARTTTTTANKGGVLSTKQTNSASATGGTFVDSSGRSVSYLKVLTGTGTAYNEPAGSSTSTGRPVEVGIVAVDPDVIPYGTRLYIVSADGKHVYGYALAADTGGALKSGKVLVDLYYDTESQCLAFGRREVVVYVLS